MPEPGPDLGEARRRAGTLTLFVACALICAGGAQAEGPAVADLVEAADITGLSLSPDGQRLAFRVERASIERNSYDLGWHVADLESGRVRRVGGGGMPIWNDPGSLARETAFWSPGGEAIVYRALVDGEIQLWRALADGSGGRAVTQEEADILSVEPAPGGRLIYRTGASRAAIRAAELSEYDGGTLVDGTVDLAQGAFRGGWVNGRLASQRLTGRWFERAGLLGGKPHSAHVLDLVTLASGPAPSGPEAGPPAPSLSARSEEDWQAFASWEGSGGSLTARAPGQSGEEIRCEASPCRSSRIAALAWRPGKREVLFTVEDRARVQSLYLWDLPAGAVRLVARAEGQLGGGAGASLPCAIGRDAAFCVAAGPVSPPRLERIDLSDGARTIVYDPNALLRALPAPQAETLEWRAAGRTFTGILLTPAGARQRMPLFITYYSCAGHLRGGIGDEWPLVPLADAGMAALCINAPPIAGRQDGLSEYRTALGGIRAVVDLLAARGLVDRGRVGMGGLSFGSEVTLWTAMHSDLLAAASVASPAMEPGYYWLTGIGERDVHAVLEKVWGLGPPDETPARWKAIAPALNVDRLREPLLMQLAEQEARYCAELYARLGRSGSPAELHVFPDEPHIKVQPRHKLAAYQRNLDWFRYWLQDYVDPDPARAGQYGRWAALRERAASRDARSQSSRVTKSRIRK